MKKSILLVTALVAAQAAFAEETAEPSNVFGLLRVDSTLTNTIVAVPWLDLSSNSTASAVSVADIVKTANLTAGDRLSAYRPDGKYDVWVLNSSKEWEPSETLVVENQSTSEAPEADVRRVALGSAFWLYRQRPTSEGAAVPFYIYGQVPASAVTTTVTAGTASAPVWNLVANARNADVALNSLTVSGSINAADEIYIVEDGNPTMYTYKEGQGWGCTTRVTGPNGRPVNRWAVSNVTISKGTGFWYASKGGAPTFTW